MAMQIGKRLLLRKAVHSNRSTESWRGRLQAATDSSLSNYDDIAHTSGWRQRRPSYADPSETRHNFAAIPFAANNHYEGASTYLESAKCPANHDPKTTVHKRHTRPAVGDTGSFVAAIPSRPPLSDQMTDEEETQRWSIRRSRILLRFDSLDDAAESHAYADDFPPEHYPNTLPERQERLHRPESEENDDDSTS
ncbi:hypothetical protein BKA82DRAFT_4009828 [Pisolithus tinctorius]|nr:hypothetical protein BKA82DRAFT_4009828 [Pisolithus tinctorius]